MSDVVKRIQFNHNGKNALEILGGVDEEIIEKEEDYKAVGKLLLAFADAPELAALLNGVICALTDLKMQRLSELVEYLYKSCTIKQLRDLQRMVKNTDELCRVRTMAHILKGLGGD